MTRSLLGGVLMVGLASSAHAQPGMTPTAPVTAPVSTEPRLSESTALGASLGGTLGSWAMVVAAAAMSGAEGSSDGSDLLGSIGGIGTFLAPSFGHWYAGSFFTRGMGLRAVGMGGAFLGFVAALGCGFGGSCDDGDETVVWALLIGGAGLYVGGTVDDIVQAPRRARRVNASRGYALMPRVGGDSVGLTLGGTF